jgi:ppGpp synthetase/RelA/SpoT-type nucleotidyltranferase
MSVIDNFIRQYEKEYDFYKEIARLGHDILETEIINRGIKAMVSSRAKRIDRLKEKIEKRNKTKNYKNKIAIEKDIPDLAGVRVALYFPSDREIVGEVIEDLFDVVETKNFPENPHKPKFGKRFSGYWATHYRVKLKKSDEVDKRFSDTVFEIQVASVLMHAWSEVEHDLVYKPLSGNLSDEELAILDEINGLVLSGEIALERLQKAITERTTKQKEVTDKYQLTNLIHSNYFTNDNKILNFGNTEYINNYLKAVQTLQTSDILNSLQKINLNIKESFSDQFLQNLIKINDNTENLRKYFGQYTSDKKKISGFEAFMKTWIVFEKVVTQLNVQYGNDTRKNFIPSIDILGKISEFSNDELEQIRESRKIRNQLLHGYQSYSNEDLEKASEDLKIIVDKSINAVLDNNVKEELQHEIKS